jgi:hypothetical protein
MLADAGTREPVNISELIEQELLRNGHHLGQ